MKMWDQDPEKPWKNVPIIKREEMTKEKVKVLTDSFKNHKVGILEKDGTVNIVDRKTILNA